MVRAVQKFRCIFAGLHLCIADDAADRTVTAPTSADGGEGASGSGSGDSGEGDGSGDGSGDDAGRSDGTEGGEAA